MNDRKGNYKVDNSNISIAIKNMYKKEKRKKGLVGKVIMNLN